jgi:hypothetical protein
MGRLLILPAVAHLFHGLLLLALLCDVIGSMGQECDDEAQDERFVAV